MSLNDLRKGIASYGAGPQLDALPSADGMTWVPQPGANPAFSLLIGSLDGQQILAYLTRYGEKPREVRYCTRPPPDRPSNKSTSSMSTVTQDDVMKASLLSPFKYLAENSKPMKRKFSMLIRWYFLIKGYIDGLEGDQGDFCKRFSSAVKRIEEEKHDEEDGTQNRTRRNREAIEESPEPEDADSTYTLRSSSRTGKTHVTNGDKSEPQSPSVRSSRELRTSKGNHDLERLLEYLKNHNALYLLDNLPEVSEMQFVGQTSIPEAQPMKLFVGREAKSGDDIYAYMVSLARGFHEVRFYVQTALDEEPMKTETVSKQRLLHPFSKCYPKQPCVLEQSDRARLTLMVKFYFISAGIATDCVLKETKKYPERLRVALDYIADRMGPAAAKPPSHTKDEDDGATSTSAPNNPPKHRLSSESSYIDESDIQSTLALEPPRLPHHTRTPKSTSIFARKSAYSTAPRSQLPSRTTSPSTFPPITTTLDPSTSTFPPPSDIITTTTTTPSTPSMHPHRSTPKRSAEDAEFEDLARIVMKEQTLTREINALQHEMDVLEERKSIWMEKWQAQFETVNEKLEAVTRERVGVRMQFKKQRLGGGEE
ncbi:hypothetical protein COCVIDRAFT_83289 [Bipolaris victoriae FI3]|uniref:Uncharacterized protein n=1 Tax=Bipolaris victoriae (strain FI3) TaxID=930091 RepID=W7F4N3_BIPV3|nr:hypothetical protein COCVIDRAFT_83289 [Bipolaris victoriae FI3]